MTPSERTDYHATLTVELQDVTADQAREFFERLGTHEIVLDLDDGLSYVADVKTVVDDV